MDRFKVVAGRSSFYFISELLVKANMGRGFGWREKGAIDGVIW